MANQPHTSLCSLPTAPFAIHLHPCPLRAPVSTTALPPSLSPCPGLLRPTRLRPGIKVTTCASPSAFRAISPPTRHLLPPVLPPPPTRYGPPHSAPCPASSLSPSPPPTPRDAPPFSSRPATPPAAKKEPLPPRRRGPSIPGSLLLAHLLNLVAPRSQPHPQSGGGLSTTSRSST